MRAAGWIPFLKFWVLTSLQKSVSVLAVDTSVSSLPHYQISLLLGRRCSQKLTHILRSYTTTGSLRCPSAYVTDSLQHAWGSICLIFRLDCAINCWQAAAPRCPVQLLGGLGGCKASIYSTFLISTVNLPHCWTGRCFRHRLWKRFCQGLRRLFGVCSSTGVLIAMQRNANSLLWIVPLTLQGHYCWRSCFF